MKLRDLLSLINTIANIPKENEKIMLLCIDRPTQCNKIGCSHDERKANNQIKAFSTIDLYFSYRCVFAVFLKVSVLKGYRFRNIYVKCGCNNIYSDIFCRTLYQLYNKDMYNGRYIFFMTIFLNILFVIVSFQLFILLRQ